MNKQDVMIKSALASLLAFGVMSATAPAMAAEKPKMEQCFGISKAGKNDCGVKNSSHSCAGQASKDGQKDAFLLVPAGTCDKIVGGSLTMSKADTGHDKM